MLNDTEPAGSMSLSLLLAYTHTLVHTQHSISKHTLGEHAARADGWFEPRIVLRSCGHPKRTSKSVLVLTPQDDFHETPRTHEKAKC